MNRIGKYEIFDRLGMGGSSIVYRGIDHENNREVAIKVLGKKFVAHRPTCDLFLENGRRVCNLDHANLVRVYEVGDAEGSPYIVMECIKGTWLEQHLPPGTELTVLERLRIMHEVCQALGYLHGNGVLHLAVQPAKVYVQESGRAKLLSVDICSAADGGRLPKGSAFLVGQNRYLAPQRYSGAGVDRRSDIFSAGVLLYVLLSGRFPFEGGLHGVFLHDTSKKPHPSLASIGLDCPDAMDEIIDRALAREPGERYSTAEEMAADLANVISEMRQREGMLYERL